MDPRRNILWRIIFLSSTTTTLMFVDPMTTMQFRGTVAILAALSIAFVDFKAMAMGMGSDGDDTTFKGGKGTENRCSSFLGEGRLRWEEWIHIPGEATGEMRMDSRLNSRSGGEAAQGMTFQRWWFHNTGIAASLVSLGMAVGYHQIDKSVQCTPAVVIVLWGSDIEGMDVSSLEIAWDPGFQFLPACDGRESEER